MAVEWRSWAIRMAVGALLLVLFVLLAAFGSYWEDRWDIRSGEEATGNAGQTLSAER